MPLLLAVLKVGFEAREDGVRDRLGSIFRFFVGGAVFFIVAVPFFVLAGAGRFLGIVGSGVATSVD